MWIKINPDTTNILITVKIRFILYMAPLTKYNQILY